MRRVCLIIAIFVAACDGSSDNNPPVSFDDTITLEEDGSIQSTLNATDTDGDPIRFSVARSPANGVIELFSDGAYTFHPNSDFFGGDSFDFLVTDNSGANDVGTVTIIVTPVNDAPVSTDQVLMGSEDSQLQLTLSVVDIDDTSLTYQITEDPLNGDAVITNGELQYTPDLNFNGSDSLTYQVDDGALTDTAMIDISIAPVDDPPIVMVTGDDYVLRGELVELDASGSSDVEGSLLTYSWEQASGPNVTLTNTTGPQTGFTAPSAVSRITLTLTVSDGQIISTEPVEIHVAGWAQVAGGSSHTVALREDGSLWAWGWNSVGQLGDGSTIDSLTPSLINNSELFVSIDAGGRTSYALRDDGTLLSFGSGFLGQLGNGLDVNSSTPVIVQGGPYTAVSAGGQFAIALKSDGTLWSWGIGDIGALGRLGISGSSNPNPGQIGLESDWIDIRAGGNAASALKSDGSLWSWGQNWHGEIGIGSIQPPGQLDGVLEPMQNGAAMNWTGLFRGDSVFFAVQDDMTLWAAGRNEWGTLGLGFTGTDEPNLVRVGAENGWQSGCASNHTLALKTDGTLWAWGRNLTGERGDSDPTNSGVPRQIGSDSDWVFVGCGQQSSFAIREDGSLWSWGNNFGGNLGHGDTVNRWAPTRVGD
jgi:alpha-tubulin suppressor-like RCC1 family protein